MKSVIGLFLISVLVAQETEVTWLPPEPPDSIHSQLCHKDFLRFWRIRTHGENGNWHLYNDEDKMFLSRWKEAVEWTALEGRLPK